MTKNTKDTEALSRRKALRRLGVFAAAAYAAPAFTTLSMAQAGSSPSAPETPSAPEAPSTPDPVSTPSTPDPVSTPSAPSPSSSTVGDTCGTEDLTNPDYVQCVVDNGYDLPEGFVVPDGVVVK